ncbi:MAG: hypothetical protein ABW178_07550 [Pseudoxanthomonas sp.]
MIKLLRLLGLSWKAPLRGAHLSGVLRNHKPGEGFREFTTPRRNQVGASVQLGPRRLQRYPGSGIIPGVGGNIP